MATKVCTFVKHQTARKLSKAMMLTLIMAVYENKMHLYYKQKKCEEKLTNGISWYNGMTLCCKQN